MNAEEATRKISEICLLAPVIPVLVVNNIAHARPLAEALVAGGLPVLEVTLRTPVALDVIRIVSRVPGAIVGAGTLLRSQDVADAKQAGAQFGVSPGVTDALLTACESESLPLLPGAATATEAMSLLAKGYNVLKFFPAEANGGVPVLMSLAGPLPQVRFCPTGGITPENVERYLELSNVLCVGGSWVAPQAHMEAERWDDIQEMARCASELGG